MKESIIDGNKLIAEFDGGELKHEAYLVFYKDYEKQDRKMYVEYENLKYHTSWEWIMPVVKKIGFIMPNEFNYDIAKMTQFVKERRSVIEIPVFSEINKVYTAVLIFITWYKENQNHVVKLKSTSKEKSGFDGTTHH